LVYAAYFFSAWRPTVAAATIAAELMPQRLLVTMAAINLKQEAALAVVAEVAD